MLRQQPDFSVQYFFVSWQVGRSAQTKAESMLKIQDQCVCRAQCYKQKGYR